MIQVYCTQIFNTHTKFLRQPATWQAETGLYMARLWSITLPCGNSWKWIKIAIQCTSDFRQFSSIHVISPWCIHLWIRLLALCDLDACMHGCMHEWMDGLMQQMDASVHCSYIVRHCGMSSSSFRWRLCCWERHWLKSSASCGHLSSSFTALVPTSRVQTNPNKLQIRPNSAQSSTSRPHHTATTCHIMSRVSESIRIYQDLPSMTLPPTWSKQKNKETTPTTTLPNIKQLHHCTYPFPHPSTSTLHSSSFLLAWQNFTAKKSQHLQSGFRLLLSLRFFLQALLAICGFFRFCYSCLYGVCLDLR